MMEKRESLPKIVDGGLQFPVLEEVPVVKKAEATKTPAVKKGFGASMAKKRFNQMAFSVLAKIIDEKQQPEEEETTEEPAGKESDEDANTKKENTQQEDEVGDNSSQKSKAPSRDTATKTTVKKGEKSLSRHGSASSLATIESNSGRPAQKKKGKKGPSFMSVIRLASYRKRMGGRALLGRKGASSVASSLGDVDEDEEKIKDLPSQPRFCATLSTEAQYAMLKCYEDVLMESIRTNKPKQPMPDDATLFRVKTPHDGLRSLHLAAADGEGARLPLLGEDEVDGSLTSKPPSRESGFSSSFAGTLHLPSISGASPIACRRPTLSAAAVALPSSLQGKLRVVPRDKQLRLSYRFQTAMDILDAVRDSNGQLITSPRAMKLTEINPLKNYNQWSKGWSKEFQYEYTGPNGGMKT